MSRPPRDLFGAADRAKKSQTVAPKPQSPAPVEHDPLSGCLDLDLAAQDEIRALRFHAELNPISRAVRSACGSVDAARIAGDYTKRLDRGHWVCFTIEDTPQAVNRHLAVWTDANWRPLDAVVAQLMREFGFATRRLVDLSGHWYEPIVGRRQKVHALEVIVKKTAEPSEVQAETDMIWGEGERSENDEDTET